MFYRQGFIGDICDGVEMFYRQGFIGNICDGVEMFYRQGFIGDICDGVEMFYRQGFIGDIFYDGSVQILIIVVYTWWEIGLNSLLSYCWCRYNTAAFDALIAVGITSYNLYTYSCTFNMCV